MLYTCYIYILYICYIYMLYIYYICYIHVIYMLYTCYIHVIYMLYIYAYMPALRVNQALFPRMYQWDKLSARFSRWPYWPHCLYDDARLVKQYYWRSRRSLVLAIGGYMTGGLHLRYANDANPFLPTPTLLLTSVRSGDIRKRERW